MAQIETVPQQKTLTILYSLVDNTAFAANDLSLNPVLGDGTPLDTSAYDDAEFTLQQPILSDPTQATTVELIGSITGGATTCKIAIPAGPASNLWNTAHQSPQKYWVSITDGTDVANVAYGNIVYQQIA